MTDKYAVIGNPIAHSKSPLIHEAFAKQTNQDISYERILAPLDDFESTVRDLIASGYKGANVTVPFKFEAYNLATRLTGRAELADAVNTLNFINKDIAGDNTDGLGLVRDITENLEINLAGKSILLLGAGGAAEGVFFPLLAESNSLLVIANRNVERAEQLAVKSLAKPVNATSFEGIPDTKWDVIINATSAGLTNTALPIPNTIFSQGCLAYDMVYGRETPFMKQARENGAQVADGLGMLVEQAAEAFYIWRGVRPETQSVIQKIRNLA